MREILKVSFTSLSTPLRISKTLNIGCFWQSDARKSTHVCACMNSCISLGCTVLNKEYAVTRKLLGNLLISIFMNAEVFTPDFSSQQRFGVKLI